MPKTFLLVSCIFQTLALASSPHLLYHEKLEADASIAKRAHTKTKIRTTTTVSGAYAIVSPTYCPPSQPTGDVIEQSSVQFSKKNAGLRYQLYENDQYIFQDQHSGPLFLDLSDPNAIAISRNGNETLILHLNGTFEAFVSSCQAQVVGSWGDSAPPSGARFRKRQTSSSSFCSSNRKLCETAESVGISSSQGVTLGCGLIAGTAGAVLGGLTEIPGGAAIGKGVGTFLCTKGLGMIASKGCDHGSVCSDPDYREASKQCSSSEGMGHAVWCCSGDCLNSCSNMYNLCLDADSPSCPFDQVLFPGSSEGVDAGSGWCYQPFGIDACQWQQNNWHWDCCNCPSGYIPVQSANTCHIGDPEGYAEGPPAPPCVGCTSGKKLVGDSTNGYYCNY